ncbi:hypothetical protein DPX39_080049000 [Trypanosoma brucei equiperdum]|uniref:Uncharacterized protein n=1 Tax=Trypanosoma brucei equiperdum TaxID=630700 RepID=A0A3L6L9G2_9TRYP|nr:hypothetical protein DPX39_080049000 [Trypanosoma brucei equiperdum]
MRFSRRLFHPYRIDVSSLERAKRQQGAQGIRTSPRVSLIHCAKRAWRKAMSGYEFFFPSSGKGGPAK